MIGQIILQICFQGFSQRIVFFRGGGGFETGRDKKF